MTDREAGSGMGWFSVEGFRGSRCLWGLESLLRKGWRIVEFVKRVCWFVEVVEVVSECGDRVV